MEFVQPKWELSSHFAPYSPLLLFCSPSVATFCTFAFRICNCKCVGVSVFVCLFFLANTFVCLRCVNIKAIINLIEVPFEVPSNFIFMQSLEICLISSHHSQAHRHTKLNLFNSFCNLRSLQMRLFNGTRKDYFLLLKVFQFN